MTKGERRKVRKAAQAAGLAYQDDAGDRDTGPVSFSPEHTRAGQRGRERWVRWQEECNGAPTDPSDY